MILTWHHSEALTLLLRKDWVSSWTLISQPLTRKGSSTWCWMTENWLASSPTRREAWEGRGGEGRGGEGRGGEGRGGREEGRGGVNSTY